MPSDADRDQLDPVFVHARREAILIVSVWALCLLWAVPYCYFNGYSLVPGEVDTILGIPSWVFWGIVVPWLLADLFTVWLCFFYMVDDDLGAAHEGLDLEEEIQERHAASEEQPHE